MRAWLPLVVLVMGLGLTGCNRAPATDAPEAVAAASTVPMPVPPGDVSAGRRAFHDLRCTACHAVPSEAAFPAPVSASPGPPFDRRLSRADPSYLLASMVTPSHAISTRMDPRARASMEGVLSPMGDFSEVMTVRQLIDLHAYLRSIE